MPLNIDVDLASLGLRPVDVLHLLDTGNEPAMNELDDRIVQSGPCRQRLLSRRVGADRIHGAHRRRHDGVRSRAAGRESPRPGARRAAAQAQRCGPAQRGERDLGRYTGGPCGSSDGRARQPCAGKNDALTLRGVLAPLANPAATIVNIVAGVDPAIDDFVDVQFAAGLCGVALAAAGPAMRARREWFELVRRNADTLARRWQDQLTECDLGLAAGGNAANSDLMRVRRSSKPSVKSRRPLLPRFRRIQPCSCPSWRQNEVHSIPHATP